MMKEIIAATIFVYVVFNLSVSVVLFANYLNDKDYKEMINQRRCSNCKHCKTIIGDKCYCKLWTGGATEPSFCSEFERCLK